MRARCLSSNLLSAGLSFLTKPTPRIHYPFRRAGVREALLALEPRIMFDAAAATDVAHSVEKAATAIQDSHHAPANESVAPLVSALSEAGPVSDARTETAPITIQPKQLAFVDANVADIKSLIKEFGSEIEIHVLDSKRDGVDQIVQALSGRQNIESVHILSHGEAGKLALGTATLTQKTVQDQYAAQMAKIGTSLTDNADILIYGCNFAAGESGKLAMQALSSATGADVAASLDDTGSIQRGGNWVLESKTGIIETRSLSASDWDGLMAKLNISTKKGPVQTGGTNLGAVGLWANAGTYGNVAIDVRATVISATAGAIVKFVDPTATGHNTGSDDLEIDITGGKVTIRWEVFKAGTNQSIGTIGNVNFSMRDVDGNTTEKLSFPQVEAEVVSPSLRGLTSYTLGKDTDLKAGVSNGNLSVQGTVDHANPTDEQTLVNFSWNNISSWEVTYEVRSPAPGNQSAERWFFHDGNGGSQFTAPITTHMLMLDNDGNDSAAIGTAYKGSFTEKGPAVGIVDSDVKITQDQALGTQLSTATITLSNAKLGDDLTVGTLPAGITAKIDKSVAGQITVTLTGKASTDDYQKALGSLRFSNSSRNPDTTDRVILTQVTNGDFTVTSDEALSTIRIIPVNDAPEATIIPDQTGVDGSKPAPLDISKNLTDPDGDKLTFSVTGLPAGLIIDPKTGIISGTLTSDASQKGPYKVTVTATDPSGASVSTSFKYNVTNPAPNADDDTSSGDAVTPRSGNVLHNDEDGGGGNDPLAVTKVNDVDLGTDPIKLQYGDLTMKSDGSWVFTPNDAAKALSNGAPVTEEVSYEISDGQGGTATAKLSLIINPDHEGPVALTIPNQSGMDGATPPALDVSTSFTDPNGEALTFSATGLPAGLSIDFKTGIISGVIDPSASIKGSYIVTVTASDPSGNEASANFKYTVANSSPTANDDKSTGLASVTQKGSVSANDRDGGADKDALIVTKVNGVSISAGPLKLQYGDLTMKSGGAWVFTPNDAAKALPNGKNVAQDVSYEISDGQGGTATAKLVINLIAENHAPVLGVLPEHLTFDGSTIVPINLGKSFTDLDGDGLTFSVKGLPPGLTYDPKTGIITGKLTSDASQKGPYKVTVTATDPLGASATGSFDYLVNNVIPVAHDYTSSGNAVTPRTGNALSNDSDGGDDQDPITATKINGVALGTDPIKLQYGDLTMKSDGSWVFTPNDAAKALPNGKNVTEEVSYEISDGQGGTATAKLTINLTGENHAPVLGTLPAQVSADDAATIVPIDLGKHFTDLDGDSLTFVVTGLPAGLTYDPKTGIVTGTLTSDASQKGPYKVTVTATDPTGASATGNFDYVVNNVAPVAIDDTVPGPASATHNGNILSNDHDGGDDKDVLSVTKINGVDLGTDPIKLQYGDLTMKSDGSWVFTPNDAAKALPNGKNVTEEVSYEISDGQGGTATAKLTINLTGENHAPVLGTLPAQVSADDAATIVPIDLGKHFTDLDGDSLTFVVTGLPAGLTYDPKTGIVTGTLTSDASQKGPYKVTVTATDPTGASATGNFDYVVNNVAPVAIDDTVPGPASATHNGNILSNDHDGGDDKDVLSVTKINGVDLGTDPIKLQYGDLTMKSDGSWVFTPNDAAKALPNGKNVTEEVSYEISDGQGGTATAKLTINLTGENHAPVLGTLPAQVSADDAATIVPIDLGKHFTDLDGDSLTFVVTGLPAGLTYDPKTGIVTGTLTSDASQKGPYKVTVTATDPTGASATGNFDYVVNNVAPVAIDDTVPGPASATHNGNILSNDHDGGDDKDVLSVTKINGVDLGTDPIKLQYGDLTMKSDGSWVFTPNDAAKALPNGKNVTEEVSYEISDGQGGTATAKLTINLTGENHAPVLGTLPAQVSADDAATIVPIDLGKHFTDLDGDSLTFVVTGLPAGLTYDPKTGIVTGTLTSDASQKGPYKVTVTATDPTGASATGNFDYVVNNVAPVAIDDTVPGPASATHNGNILSNDHDGGDDKDVLSVTKINGVDLGTDPIKLQYGDLTMKSDGSWVFTPNDAAKALPNGKNVTEEVSYEISDGQGGTATAKLTINLTGENHAPVLGTLPAQVSADDAATIVPIDLGKHFTDLDGDSLTFVVTGLPAGLTYDPKTGIVTGTLTSDASQKGPYKVTVTATDPTGASATGNFDYVVNNVAPVAIDDTVPGPASATHNGNILSNDHDGGDDKDVLSVTKINGVDLGTDPIKLQYGDLTMKSDGSWVFTPNDAAKALPNGKNVTEEVSYEISDGQGGTATAKLTINLTGENHAPVLGTLPAQVSADDAATIVPIDLGKHFTDLDGDSLTFVVTGLPAGLTYDPKTGIVTGTLTSDASQKGPYKVTVTATDPTGASATGNFDYVVSNVAPVAIDDTVPGPASATHNGNILSNDHDGGDDKDVLSVTKINGVDLGTDPIKLQYGDLTMKSDGSWVFTPNDAAKALPNGKNVTEEVSYEISDGQGGTATAKLTINLTGENHAPVLGTLPAQVSADDAATIVPIDLGKHFTDLDGDSLTFVVTGLPAGLTYDPKTGIVTGTLTSDASQKGPYKVTVTATDPTGASATGNFDYVVNNVAPVAIDDTVPGPASATHNGNILSNDHDGGDDKDVLSVTKINGVDLGTDPIKLQYGDLTMKSDGSWVFTPNDAAKALPNGKNVTEEVSYEISDGQGGTATAKLTINLTGENHAPVLGTLPAQVSADDAATIVPIDLGKHFTDLDGDSLTFVVTGLPAGLTYDPKTGIVTGTLTSDASQKGPYKVTVTATDPTGASATGNFDYVVSNVAPVAIDDTVPGPASATHNGNILSNDHDGGDDKDVLSVTKINGVDLGTDPIKLQYGDLTMKSDGSWVFTPNDAAKALPNGKNVTEEVSYEISDGQGGTATAKLTINLTGENHAPVLGTLPAQVSADDAATIVPIDLGKHFTDLDGDSLTFVVTGLPAGLTYDPKTGIVTGTLTSDASQKGPYKVTVTATDPTGASATGNFDYVVNNVAPVAIDDTVPGPASATHNGNILSNDHDGGDDKDVLSVTKINGVDLGTDPIKLQYGDLTMKSDGSWVFTPNDAAKALPNGKNVTEEVSYEISDGQGGTATAKLTINLTGENHAPVLGTLPAQVSADDAATIVPIDLGKHFTDLDGDSLTFVVTGLPAGLTYDPKTGIVTGTLTSDASQKGPYKVTVTATDPTGASATGNFDYVVSNVAPVAIDDTVPGPASATHNGNILSNDHDGGDDKDVLSVTKINGVDLGTDPIKLQYGDLTMKSDGSWVFTPNDAAKALPNGKNVTEEVSYEISDGQGGTATAKLTINLTGENHAPSVTPISDQNSMDGATPPILDVAKNFTDVDGDALTFTAIGLPPGLSLDPKTGIISGTVDPSASVKGPYSVTITATDSSGTQALVDFVYNISNPAPTTIGLLDRVGVDGQDVGFSISDQFIDPDGGQLNFSASGLPSGLQIDPISGVIFGTLAADASSFGPYRITITAFDQKGGVVATEFTYQITPPANQTTSLIRINSQHIHDNTVGNKPLTPFQLSPPHKPIIVAMERALAPNAKASWRHHQPVSVQAGRTHGRVGDNGRENFVKIRTADANSSPWRHTGSSNSEIAPHTGDKIGLALADNNQKAFYVRTLIKGESMFLTVHKAADSDAKIVSITGADGTPMPNMIRQADKETMAFNVPAQKGWMNMRVDAELADGSRVHWLLGVNAKSAEVAQADLNAPLTALTFTEQSTRMASEQQRSTERLARALSKPSDEQQAPQPVDVPTNSDAL